MIKNITQPGDINYSALLNDLAEIRDSTQQAIEKKVNTVLLLGYWMMGKRLCEEDVFDREDTEGAGSLLKKLSFDLDVEYTLLSRMIKFYRQWPKMCPAEKNPNISWSHYKSLMAIEDESERDFYLKEAQKKGWGKLALAYKVKHDYAKVILAPKKVPENALARDKQALYFYSGQVRKVVDGDTLIVDADLGFFVRLTIRVRLKGINTAEMGEGDEDQQVLALKAREFVQTEIDKVKTIVFQTFRVDLYGRYVADVFYLPGEDEKQLIFENGLFLNQELVNAGLAKIV